MTKKQIIITSLIVGLTIGGLAARLITAREAKRFSQSSADLHVQIDLANKEGIPIEMGQVSSPAPPLEDNGAPLLLEAERIWKGLPKADQDALVIRMLPTVPTPEQKNRVKGILKKFDKLAAQLEAAYRRPRCDFEHDFADGFSEKYPELAMMKTWARLEINRGYVAALEGDRLKAMQSLRNVLKLRQFAHEGHHVISHLVTVALERMALSGAEDYLTAWKGDAQAIQELRVFLKSMPPIPKLIEALPKEVVINRIAMDNLRKDPELAEEEWQAVIKKITLSGIPNKDVPDAFEAHILSAWREVFPILQRESVNEWEKGKLISAVGQRELESGLPYMASGLLFELQDDVGGALELLTTHRMLLSLTLDAVEYRNAHKKWSEVQVRADSFGRIGCLMTDASVIYYSLGPDGKDNRGAKKIADSAEKDYAVGYPTTRSSD